MPDKLTIEKCLNLVKKLVSFDLNLHVLYKYMLVIAGMARRLSMWTPTDKPIRNAIKTNHLLELICLNSSSHFKIDQKTTAVNNDDIA